MAEAVAGSRPARQVPTRLVVAVVLGVLLNPLNSSMIAVALLRLRDDFGVGVATASWLISAFYLTAAVGQPLLGRVADLFGARRIFGLGLGLVCLSSAAVPLAPSFGWLVAARVVQACGMSAGFPCALVLVRNATGDPTGRPPAGVMGVLSVTGSISAALGPVLGGLLVSLAGWQAIFLVNVPITLAGLAAMFAWVPPDPPRAPERGRAVAATVDVPGVLLFAVGLTGLLGFLLSIPDVAALALLPVVAVVLALLVAWEVRARTPFLDVRMLASNRPLSGVYAQFTAINLAFYGAFLGLPLWLQQERGLPPRETGLLLLPITGIGMLVTPVAVRLINRRGIRPPLVLGSAGLALAALLLLTFDSDTPVAALAVVSAVLGLPNAFNNLGLQAGLYAATPPEATGAAAGLFQTSRYLGAILSTSLLGLVFGRTVSSGGLHLIGLSMAAIGAVLFVATIMPRRSPRHETRR
jgi:MFS family permease